jgi:hypothetical protein
MGQISLRDRAEQAAELLAEALSAHADAALLERTGRLLRQLPQRSPASEEARLLADAVNLDDFGVIGLIAAAVHQSRQSCGILQVVEGFQKRHEYGYWDARLKDGFHFEPVRQMARRRLAHAARVAEMLISELKEDQVL